MEFNYHQETTVSVSVNHSYDTEYKTFTAKIIIGIPAKSNTSIVDHLRSDSECICNEALRSTWGSWNEDEKRRYKQIELHDTDLARLNEAVDETLTDYNTVLYEVITENRQRLDLVSTQSKDFFWHL